MTVRLSPQKVRKLVTGYFAGIPQTTIARKARVDQSSVSVYASRFKQRAAEVGILAAGKEYGVYDEVSALRSLSMELSALGITVEDANEGLGIIEMFFKLGVNPDRHAVLVEVCDKVADPRFVRAAMKLVTIEDESGIGYDEALSRFEEATSKLPHVEKQLAEKRAQLVHAESNLAQRKQELAGVENAMAVSRKNQVYYTENQHTTGLLEWR